MAGLLPAPPPPLSSAPAPAPAPWASAPVVALAATTGGHPPLPSTAAGVALGAGGGTSCRRCPRAWVEPHLSGLLLHQRQYVLDILERAGMTDCKPCSTPVDTQAKLSTDMSAPVANPTAFRSLAGALQYLTFTKPYVTSRMPFSRSSFICMILGSHIVLR
jgi:hypothetical protein